MSNKQNDKFYEDIIASMSEEYLESLRSSINLTILQEGL